MKIFLKSFIGLQKGFSIIELIVYMGILSSFLLIMMKLFTTTVDIQLESQATSSVEQDGRFILDRLTYDVQRASTISFPPLSATTSSSLQLVINGINYTYASSSGNLTLTDNVGTDNLNGFDSTVSNLTFQQLGKVGGENDVVFGFTISSRTIRNSGPEKRTYLTTIQTRCVLTSGNCNE